MEEDVMFVMVLLELFSGLLGLIRCNAWPVELWYVIVPVGGKVDLVAVAIVLVCGRAKAK